jgi:hypothetical protein
MRNPICFERYLDNERVHKTKIRRPPSHEQIELACIHARIAMNERNFT